MIGSGEIIWIVIIALIVIFGSSKLPEIGRGIGEAIKNFKKSLSESKEIDVTPKKGPEEGRNSGQDNSNSESAPRHQDDKEKKS
jgi:sec-independent protein translocase protein TatA